MKRKEGATDHLKEKTVGKVNVTCQSFEEVTLKTAQLSSRWVFVSGNCLLLFVTIKCDI